MSKLFKKTGFADVQIFEEIVQCLLLKSKDVGSDVNVKDYVLDLSKVKNVDMISMMADKKIVTELQGACAGLFDGNIPKSVSDKLF